VNLTGKPGLPAGRTDAGRRPRARPRPFYVVPAQPRRPAPRLGRVRGEAIAHSPRTRGLRVRRVADAGYWSQRWRLTSGSPAQYRPSPQTRPAEQTAATIIAAA
jgi:hypothetical protein